MWFLVEPTTYVDLFKDYECNYNIFDLNHDGRVLTNFENPYQFNFHSFVFDSANSAADGNNDLHLVSYNLFINLIKPMIHKAWRIVYFKNLVLQNENLLERWEMRHICDQLHRPLLLDSCLILLKFLLNSKYEKL